MKNSATVLLAVGLVLLAAFSAFAIDRPNVLFILVDDLGWSDVSYNGSHVYETPHVDQLARQGMVLTDFSRLARSARQRGPRS